MTVLTLTAAHLGTDHRLTHDPARLGPPAFKITAHPSGPSCLLS